MTQPIEPKATVREIDVDFSEQIITIYDPDDAPIWDTPLSSEAQINQTLAALWEVAIPALREIAKEECHDVVVEEHDGDIRRILTCQDRSPKKYWCDSCLAAEPENGRTNLTAGDHDR